MIPSILPGCEVHLLAGASGVGKTALTAWLLKQLRDGQPIFGQTPIPPPYIAFLAGDRPWKDHRQWFEAVGWPDIPHYSLIDDPGADLDKLRAGPREKPFPALRRALDVLQADCPAQTLPQGSLLVLDPLTLFLGVDPTRAGYLQTASALGKLGRLCLHDWHCTLIATYHAGKQKADKNQRYLRAQDKILGSMALLGFTGTQMFLSAPEEIAEPYYEFLWNPHHHRQEAFPLTRQESSGLFVPWAVAQEEAEMDQLLALFPIDGKPQRTNAIEVQAQKQLGLSRSTLHRYLARLLADGLLDRPVRGFYRRVDPSLASLPED